MRIRRVLATGMAILIALCAVCGDCSAATVAAKGVQTLEESVDPERTGVEEDPAGLKDDDAVSTEEPIPSADFTEREEDGLTGESEVTLPDKDDEQKLSVQKTADATAPKTIKAFVTLEESEFRFDEKPSLEDAIAAFPKTIQAVLEDDSVVEIEVKDWECISDYEEEAEAYEFKPVIKGYELGNSAILPVATIFIQLSECLIKTYDDEIELLLSSGERTLEDALVWVERQNGEKLDVDHAYGPQCVDLIQAYYRYLGYGDYARGFAKAYAYNDVPPNGWRRIYSDYKPGDIIVHKTNYVCTKDVNKHWTGENGHVSIMFNDCGDGEYFEAYDQTSGRGSVGKDRFHYECVNCAIRPVFFEHHGPDPSQNETTVSIDINNKPSGTYYQSEKLSLNGSIHADAQFQYVEVGVIDKSKMSMASMTLTTILSPGKARAFPAFTGDYSGSDTYRVSGSELNSKMKFESLGPGDYIFYAYATCKNGAYAWDKSEFTVKARKTQKSNLKPNISLSPNSDYEERGDTYAVCSAYLTNPAADRISKGGMILYDESGNEIGRKEENLNDYRQAIYLYYSTDSTHTSVNLGKQLLPGTKYRYRIWAIVGGQKCETEGEFKTTGSLKPATPTLSVDGYEYAAGDALTIRWNEVDYVTGGYYLTIAKAGGEARTIHATSNSAVVTLPEAGEYDVSIVAVGSVDSDTGRLGNKIKAYPDCNVKFMEVAEDGTENILKEETVKYGKSASAPTAPSRTGWIFQGWDKGYYNVKTDTVVKARFTKCIYSVVFKDMDGKIIPAVIDGESVETQRVEYMGTAVLPGDPEPPAGYVFTGWDSDAYLHVTENSTITATYVYENAQLPVQITANSCAFDSDGTGYTFSYNVTNYNLGITKGRAIVALMTSDDRLVYTTESNAFTLKRSDHKENVEVFLPYEGDAAKASIVIVNSFVNSIPLSEKKTIEVTRDWSSWSAEEPSASIAAEDKESRPEYRYRDKTVTESTTANLAGWVYDKTIEYWTDWSNWSAWSRTQYYGSDTRQVNARTVVDQDYDEQKWYHYHYWRGNYSMFSSYDGPGKEYRFLWHPTWDTAYMISKGNEDPDKECFECVDKFWFYGNDFERWYKSDEIKHIHQEHTEWQFRDRQKAYKYRYYKWSDWSEWSTQEYTASENREVEKRKVWRYRSTAPETAEWDGAKYTVSGTVSDALAGKQAILVVYKHEEPSDFTNEYLGQSVIGDDGSYSFEFFTREKPTVETGDFTVKLGIEGANELMYVRTIEAPKPVYTVRFLDWNGDELDTMQVPEGASAVTDVIPARAGYRFIGWNTGLTNVHDNMDVVALYEEVRYTVFFIDKMNDTLLSVEYTSGDEIVFPSTKIPDGYELTGWLNEDYETVETATANMVLTAYYEPQEYTVKFFDADGSELSTYTAFYGESVPAPEPSVPDGQRFAGWSTYDYTSVNRNMDVHALYAYLETTATPSADVRSCVLEESTAVTLSCEEGGILYTTDGTDPTPFSSEYTEPIMITQNTVLKFMARSANKNDSKIVTETYILQDAEDINGSLMIKPTKYQVSVGQDDVGINTVLAYPDNPSIEIDFYTLDDSVAVVDENGTLTGISVGTTRVLAMTRDCRYADYCEVTVTSDDIEVTSLELNKDSLELLVGEEETLLTTIEPADATYQDVCWSSNDNEVVMVDANGCVKAVGSGYACITALSHTGSSITHCYVSVENTELALNNYDVILEAGQTYQLRAIMGGRDQAVTWKSNHPAIATVDENGLLEAVSAGDTTILATAESGEFRTCKVHVTQGDPADEIELLADRVRILRDSVDVTGTEIRLDAADRTNNYVTLSATAEARKGTRYSPDGVFQSFRWESGNTKVATVSPRGVVKAVSDGTAVIRAISMEGSDTAATVTIRVSTLVQEIEVIGSGDLARGKKAKLSVSVYPQKATNKNVDWTSSAPAVVKVDAGGNVTALAIGRAEITAAAKDGSGVTSDPFVISVKAGTEQVSIKKGTQYVTNSTLGLDLDEVTTLSLTAENSAANAALEDVDQRVTWKSANLKVATVDETGLVTAVGTGTAQITATSADGTNKSGKVTVNVTRLVQGITLSGETKVGVGRNTALTARITPDSATNKSLAWSVSDAGKASVSNGKVTIKPAAAAGSTITVTATAKDGSGVSGTHVITVVPLVDKVTILKGDEDYTKKTVEQDLSANNKIIFTAVCAGRNAGDEVSDSVTWKSSNEKVATVVNGTVTLHAAGTATITAAAADGSNKNATVSVKATQSEITITGPVEVASGKNVKLVSAGPAVTWEIAGVTPAVDQSKREITISSAGQLSVKNTVAPGTQITVKATEKIKGDGPKKSETYLVTVRKPGSFVSIFRGDENMTGGTIGVDRDVMGEVTLTAAVAGDASGNTTDVSQLVSWKTGNAKVATVSETGVVTPLSAGTTKITATTTDGTNKNASVTINVASLTQSIRLTAAGNATMVAQGKAMQFTAVAAPYRTANKTFVWRCEADYSEVEDAAFISANLPKNAITVTTAGRLTVNARVPAGTKIRVFAAAKDGSGVESAGYTVTVTKPAARIDLFVAGEESGAGAADRALTGKKYGMDRDAIGATVSLTALAGGQTAYDGITAEISQEVIWSTTNAKVAVVSPAGVVTSVGAGTAQIKATSADGTNKMGSVTINVASLVTGIAIAGPSTIAGGKASTAKYTVTVTPDKAADKKVTWSAVYQLPAGSNVTIKPADIRIGNGTLSISKTVPKGTKITITATASDGSRKSADKVVKVE